VVVMSVDRTGKGWDVLAAGGQKRNQNEAADYEKSIVQGG